MDIEDPPVTLYVKGDARCLNDIFSIAVVGTRHPSEYGEDAAYKLGSLLAKKGITVIGGLAEGCDTAAHKGCLKSNGRTIAVLAHGLDRVYPAQNKKLAEDIFLNGCLISEYPPGEPANKGNFIQRDRLQSALSAGIIVVETDIAGGTMHTVYYCLRQDRMLGCIKHPSGYRQSQSRGNELILKAYSEPHLFQQLKSHLDADRKTLDLLFEKRGLILPVDLDDLNTLENFLAKSKANFGVSKVTKKSFSNVGFGFFEDRQDKPSSGIIRDDGQLKNEDELNRLILIKKFRQLFSFELDGFKLAGKIDRVDKLNGNGEVEIIDYKTGREPSK